MIVRALGDFSASETTAQSFALGEDTRFAIDRFPATTRLLELEVRGFGGALRTIGRTDVFDIESLADDGTVAVFMAPLLGVCPTGSREPLRHNALLASAGSGVLLVGGNDNTGAALSSADFYDPGTGSFAAVDDALYGQANALGLSGASLTTLRNGKIALVGGAATAFQVFEPSARAFGAPAFFREARGHHAAAALDDGRLFVAGGCSQMTASGCVRDSALRTSSLLDTDSGDLEVGPALEQVRIGGVAYLESATSIVLVGGVDPDGVPVSQAERVFLDGRASERIAGTGGVSVQTEAGSIWIGMAGREQAATASISVIAPGMQEASGGLAADFADDGVTMVSLQDGSVLALGRAGAQRLRSLDGAAESLDVAELEDREELQAIRLPDGSVLALVSDSADADTEAFVFRPALIGPNSSSATASFSSPELSEGLSARDPGQVQFVSDDGDHLQLRAGKSEEEYLLVAGPHVRSFALETAVATESGALTLFFGWRSPAEHWKIVLRSSSLARLFRVEDGVASERGACAGKTLGADALAGAARAHEVQLRIRDGQLRATVDGAEVLACDLDELEDELDEGRVGVGVEGSEGQMLRVDIISLAR